MILYNYIRYLDYLTNKLDGFFKNQQPYICCKKGCAKCCKNGNYPFTELEFKYLMMGFKKLDVNTQNNIKNKIQNIFEDRLTFEGDHFMYECPFLNSNEECLVYDFRGIICRTFGLMYFRDDGSSKIPFCAFEGLNYSKVLDAETKTISEEKYKELGNVIEPYAFNVSYNYLTNEDHEFAYSIQFGERKTLLDWLVDEFKIQ